MFKFHKKRHFYCSRVYRQVSLTANVAKPDGKLPDCMENHHMRNAKLGHKV